MKNMDKGKTKQCRFCNYYHGDTSKDGEGACHCGSVGGVFADYVCGDFSPKYKYQHIKWENDKEE